MIGRIRLAAAELVDFEVAREVFEMITQEGRELRLVDPVLRLDLLDPGLELDLRPSLLGDFGKAEMGRQRRDRDDAARPCGFF